MHPVENTATLFTVNEVMLKKTKTGQEGETSGPGGDLDGFRKLLKMIYILLEKGQYYDPNYAVKATE